MSDSRAPPAPVAIVGVGNMGLSLALRLLERGHAVRVHDRLPERMALAAAAGAVTLPSPAQAAAGCALVIVVVVDAVQTEAVLFGDQGVAATLDNGANGINGADVMLCPTIAPDDVERLAARLAGLGIGCLDAPMSGGPLRARAGLMSLMLACADTLAQRHAAVLADLSNAVFRVGTRCGDGARTKLVNNLLAAINLAGAAEAIALAQRLGLDAQRTLDVIAQSSGQSWIASDRMPRALVGDFAPRAHTTLLAKDSALALTMAAGVGVVPALGAQAAALFQDAVAAGFGADDDARLLSLLQARWAAAGQRRG